MDLAKKIAQKTLKENKESKKNDKKYEEMGGELFESLIKKDKDKFVKLFKKQVRIIALDELLKKDG